MDVTCFMSIALHLVFDPRLEGDLADHDVSLGELNRLLIDRPTDLGAKRETANILLNPYYNSDLTPELKPPPEGLYLSSHSPSF